jgi:hypothetical protein
VNTWLARGKIPRFTGRIHTDVDGNRVCCKSPTPLQYRWLFFGYVKGFERLNATRMSVAADSSTEAIINFLQRRKYKQIPITPQLFNKLITHH